MYQLSLSPEEVREITGYTRYTQQQHQLRCHGIPFTIGPRNQPIVLRKHVYSDQVLPQLSEYVMTEPDFGALKYGKTT